MGTTGETGEQATRAALVSAHRGCRNCKGTGWVSKWIGENHDRGEGFWDGYRCPYGIQMPKEEQAKLDEALKPKTKKLYLIGALKNPRIPEIAAKLRQVGWDVFDDWFAAGPDADDCWRDYERARGHTLPQALEGRAAKHVFQFDRHHLDTCDLAILVLPAGRSGHLELGYVVGKGKPGYILLDGDPERYDVMYQFAFPVFGSEAEMLDRVKP